MANVTAFVLDPDHVQASEDGMTVPPLAGLWTNERPITPAALGLSLGEMRDAIEKLSLPLVEVKVPAEEAIDEIPPADYLWPTETLHLGATPPPAEPGAELAAEPGEPEPVGEPEPEEAE